MSLLLADKSQNSQLLISCNTSHAESRPPPPAAVGSRFPRDRLQRCNRPARDSSTLPGKLSEHCFLSVSLLFCRVVRLFKAVISLWTYRISLCIDYIIVLQCINFFFNLPLKNIVLKHVATMFHISNSVLTHQKQSKLQFLQTMCPTYYPRIPNIGSKASIELHIQICWALCGEIHQLTI